MMVPGGGRWAQWDAGTGDRVESRNGDRVGIHAQYRRERSGHGLGRPESG